jgi:adenylyltransferase/sulfurtransferase
MSGSKLSAEELEYYSRQMVLKEIGYNGQLKLKEAKVCLVGVGGLGSSIATQLAAMGVGHLRLVDRDVVEYSNLHRQHLYDMDSLGRPKVEVAAQKLRKLNPNIEVEPLPLSVNASNALEVVGDANVVVDGLDHMAPRYAVNRACVKLGKPYVFGSAITTMGNASTILPRETPCLECFYGNLDDSTLPTCAVVGVHPAIVNIIASIEVSETISVLLGEKPSLAGKLLLGNLRDASFEKIIVARAEGCPVCGTHPQGEPMPLKEDLLEEVCGREGRRTFVISPKRILKLDMEALRSLLHERGLSVTTRAELGVTFKPAEGASVNILSSGVMIAEGFKEAEKVRQLYEDLIAKGLGAKVETPRNRRGE